MVKNNKNLIINILIFFMFLILFKNISIENFVEKDIRGCEINLETKEKVILKGDLNCTVNGQKYECCNTCHCPKGYICKSNVCYPVGKYSCIDSKTGNCREFDLTSYKNSDWDLPFEGDFNGFRSYCKFKVNDPNNLNFEFDELAINGGCPVNNFTSTQKTNLKRFYCKLNPGDSECKKR